MNESQLHPSMDDIKGHSCSSDHHEKIYSVKDCGLVRNDANGQQTLDQLGATVNISGEDQAKKNSSHQLDQSTDRITSYTDNENFILPDILNNFEYETERFVTNKCIPPSFTEQSKCVKEQFPNWNYLRVEGELLPSELSLNGLKFEDLPPEEDDELLQGAIVKSEDGTIALRNITMDIFRAVINEYNQLYPKPLMDMAFGVNPRYPQEVFANGETAQHILDRNRELVELSGVDATTKILLLKLHEENATLKAYIDSLVKCTFGLDDSKDSTKAQTWYIGDVSNNNVQQHPRVHNWLVLEGCVPVRGEDYAVMADKVNNMSVKAEEKVLSKLFRLVISRNYYLNTRLGFPKFERKEKPMPCLIETLSNGLPLGVGYRRIQAIIAHAFRLAGKTKGITYEDYRSTRNSIQRTLDDCRRKRIHKSSFESLQEPGPSQVKRFQCAESSRESN